MMKNRCADEWPVVIQQRRSSLTKVGHYCSPTALMIAALLAMSTPVRAVTCASTECAASASRAPRSTIAPWSSDWADPWSEVVLRFGTAVAVIGEEILIGRPGPSARPGSPRGGVHVFHRITRSGRWTERLVLAPTDVGAGDDFGATLSADGPWLAVGAPRARGGRGAVYMFERMGPERWVQRVVLTASAAESAELFGAALALRGGVLVVGAPGYRDQRGRAIVFQRGTDARWTEHAVLTSADTSHMAFGQALALTAGEVFVGAAGPLITRRAADGQERAPEAPARVLVFCDSAGKWIAASPLTSPDSAAPGAPNRPNAFGVALITDGTGTDLWVGDPAASGGGAVVQFRRQASGHWSAVERLTPTARRAGDFGASLAHDGDDLLISAPSGEAALYVFRDSTGDRAGPALVPAWAEVGRLPLAGDSAAGLGRRGGLPLARRPSWFRGTLALAAAHGVAVVGTAWSDQLEGWGLTLERRGVPSSAPSRADTGARSRQRAPAGTPWQVTATLTDTAWNSHQPLIGRTVPCRHRQAQVFGCDRVDLLAFLPVTALAPGTPRVDSARSAEPVEVSGLWGWTDSATGREFALVGHTNGTTFVEVTNPIRPKVLGVLPIPDSATPSLWRDIKVYKNYAFIVSDNAGPHGLQIFDLTQLRSVTGAPAVFKPTARYTGIASAHTLALNAASGYAYSAGNAGGGETCGGGLHMLDVHTPAKPAFVGCYAEPKAGGESGETYIHESQCVTYHGPDAAYQGREICLNASGSAVSIADVTDKENPTTLSIARYPNISYAHQGWLTADQRYFFVDDEFDEFRRVFGGEDPAQVRTRTLVFDLRELADPVLVTEFLGTTGAADHNLYIRGRYMYQSNYTAGLRVIDVADPRRPREVGSFDTAPAYDDAPPAGAPRMSQGTWTNYPYFRSGAIAVTSMSEGLYLVRFRSAGQP